MNQAEINDHIHEAINAGIEKFRVSSEDGFTVTEVAGLVLSVGADLVEAVQNVQGLSGSEKKETVKSVIRGIYDDIDPNLPWIPEFIENRLEDTLLGPVLDGFIDVIVGKYQDIGFFGGQVKAEGEAEQFSNDDPDPASHIG
jgi:hypothetical protein